MKLLFEPPPLSPRVVAAVFYFRTKAWTTGQAAVPTYRAKAQARHLEVIYPEEIISECCSVINVTVPFISSLSCEDMPGLFERR